MKPWEVYRQARDRRGRNRLRAARILSGATAVACFWTWLPLSSAIFNSSDSPRWILIFAGLYPLAYFFRGLVRAIRPRDTSVRAELAALLFLLPCLLMLPELAPLWILQVTCAALLARLLRDQEVQNLHTNRLREHLLNLCAAKTGPLHE